MSLSISVENLSKKYDISKLKKETQFREAFINFSKRLIFREKTNKEEIWALKNVSFTVEKGEIVGIIGRNGAGKSTLLKILSKITYPTSGNMRVFGRVGSLLEVGTGFHYELSGRENVYLNGSILGMTKKEVKAKMDAIVAFAEVEKFLDTPIKRYSSGMRLRLGFAVAAHLETDILFVDEVLAVGDVSFQKKCMDTMKDIRNSGRTVIFVSHTMATVENLCPRVLYFNKGELQQDGRCSDVIQKYLSDFGGTEQIAKFDFSKITNREGKGEIRYTAIEFLELDGTPKEVIHSGDSIKVRLHYQVNEPVSKPEFFFRIITQLGVTVATLGHVLSGQEIERLDPGPGYIDIDIDNINIMPDRYFISLFINSNNIMISKNTIIHDGVSRCAVFDIEVPKQSNFSKAVYQWCGIISMSCKWKIKG